ncbi:hypothetical protein RN001_003316 [Aquatica leii]|uniref:Uncharacterized protein n=1 Tax=Aquatica leii TaxID=1421715 RepID=A0AAN7QBL5_9COLE|nr:hypothetical protein RN001_003316 [Aquatica leii]
MTKLLENEWSMEVSTEANKNLNIKRFNKPTIIPVTEDLQKMKIYLDNLISESKLKLEENNKDETAYKSLIEATYCSLLLFNKKRVGELQRLLLDTYEKHLNTSSSKEFEKFLSPSEKILLKKLKRIVIKGKRSRGVPVLVDKATEAGIDLTIKHRHNFFEVYNPYLFGTCHTEDSTISGYHVFSKHALRVLKDKSKAKALTSTRMRKHLATISQILKMDNEDLEQLATFMGHTTKTHAEWYRLPLDIIQTAKVSKLLLLAQNSDITEFKGRNLNEINIGDEIVETQSESEEETEKMVMESKNDQKRCASPKANTNKKKKTITRNAWSKEEREVTEIFFEKHIKNKIPPKKEEVENLIARHPELFKNRKWDVIKAYVYNKYTKK